MKKEEELLKEVTSHYQAWTDDRDIRLTRKYGWDDVTDAYYGRLPDDWPFTSKTTDPRIRTALIEKNARLVGGKLKGRLVPRESGDIISARINNAKLDFDWDNATEGGSMQVKLSISDMDTRLYGSKFALVKWKCEYDDEGKVKFEGNEATPLDIRDCGLDYSASHIKDSKWFQHSSWEYIEDLENQNDTEGKPLFKNLGKIKESMAAKQQEAGTISSERKNNYSSRIKELRGLQDRIGTDIAFPMLEIVTEYRKDQWITFSPQYNQIIRTIDNPYIHGRIPVAQLRYYPLQDDPIGENEVESVIPLWRAIQATLCGYMDEVILKMRPPLKIIEGAARIETIVYGPEAQWLMTRPDAITEMQSNGEAVRYFETTYTALTAAFNTAIGMMSQGTSSVDPFNPQKTATEVRASVKQQNVRDDKNQSDLSEFIKDIMLMWLSNNKQFVFSNPKKQEYLLRIIGQENFAYFKQAGLDESVASPESAQVIADIVQQNPNITPGDLDSMIESAKMPKYPVVMNPNEKNPDNYQIKPKMRVNETGDVAEISMVPDDMNGTYDYIPDVKSMAVGAEQELMQGRQNAVNTLLASPTSPFMIQLLQGEGFRPKVKELLSATFEDLGLKDADRFFEKIQNVQPQPGQVPGQPGQPTNDQPQAGAPQMGGVQPPMSQQGLPGLPQTTPPVGVQQQMAGSLPTGLR